MPRISGSGTFSPCKRRPRPYNRCSCLWPSQSYSPACMDLLMHIWGDARPPTSQHPTRCRTVLGKLAVTSVFPVETGGWGGGPLGCEKPNPTSWTHLHNCAPCLSASVPKRPRAGMVRGRHARLKESLLPRGQDGEARPGRCSDCPDPTPPQGQGVPECVARCLPWTPRHGSARSEHAVDASGRVFEVGGRPPRLGSCCDFVFSKTQLSSDLLINKIKGSVCVCDTQDGWETPPAY